MCYKYVCMVYPMYEVYSYPLACNIDIIFLMQPACSLHFHMSNSEYSRLGVYSLSSAPGIIIAHGNWSVFCVVYH